MLKKYYERFLFLAARQILGERMTEAIMAAEGRVSLHRLRKSLTRRKILKSELNGSKSILHDLSRTCLKHLIPVTEPLALISQIQRSGGTLLSRLFDGHPQLHAHPYELKIGYPKKYFWPVLDLRDSPEAWFEILFEDIVVRLFKEGYHKERSDETFPFIFLPALQKEIFCKYLAGISRISQRDIFDAYMTSFFGAWLNNYNVLGSKKFVTGFTPRLSMKVSNMNAFFHVYPDGRLISIVRDPKNWYPSALRHAPQKKHNKYGDIDNALAQWQENGAAMLRNKEMFADRVCIIRFEDLVSRTADVMQYLCEFLDIDFNDILLIPTFNCNQISANTSFGPEKEKILRSTLYRYQTLSPEVLRKIDTETGEIYQALLDEAVDL
ncbi:MAG: sulfotransferase [Deltaproteobacteria bacterium]|nr:sulfotransferase [Deltaproteobacteria bacterium]